MDLVFLGIQGSGKGTQAKRLAAEFGYRIFEAGGELRKIASQPAELGLKVKSYVDAGHLVPHEIIMQVFRQALLNYKRDEKLLFDGIPRDLDQMRDFDSIMSEIGRDFRCVHFILDAEEGVTRILGRAKAEGRVDDQNVESIRRRMSLFAEKTMPVIERYKAAGKVTEIEASRSVEEVYEELRGIVSRLA